MGSADPWQEGEGICHRWQRLWTVPCTRMNLSHGGAKGVGEFLSLFTYVITIFGRPTTSDAGGISVYVLAVSLFFGVASPVSPPYANIPRPRKTFKEERSGLLGNILQK